MKNTLVLALLLLLGTTAFSQTPVLKVQGNTESSEVYLQSLDIQVDVTGSVASTKYTMTFKNRTSKILEGELLFPLPDGVTVSSYALDINGKMREAVPVDKSKGTQVFEEIEQRRVDPGLLERVEGNNFRTRIYPIPSNGSRTITIGYEEELSIKNGQLQYRLPMDYKESIDNFSIKATVWQSKSTPKIDGQINGFQFDKEGLNYVANFSRKNYKANSLLAFSLPVAENVPQVVMQSASGSFYFVASSTPKADSRKKEWGSNLGLIWDASLSALNRDVAKEIELLDIIIKEKKNLSITLYLLNNKFVESKTYNIRNSNWVDLKADINKIVYDGGTNYSSIKVKSNNIDEFLFLSDGLSTLSDANFSKNFNKPVHCIVSSARADYSALKLVASQTKGKFINVSALSDDELKKELTFETLQFLGIEAPRSVREVYPSIATPVGNNFSVAGIMEGTSADITLLFGYGNKVEKRVKVNLQSKDASKETFVHRIWAQKKINELDMEFEKNKDELTELGQQFGIVTRNTSLIVLETLQDYITYGITPPAELRSEYVQWQKNQESARQQREQSLLASAISAANELKTWWDTDFVPKKPKFPQPDKISDIEAAPPAGNFIIVEDDFDFVEDEMVLDAVVVRREVQAEAEAEEISVVAFGESRVSGQMASLKSVVAGNKTITKEVASPKPTIKLAEINQDSEYLKSFTGDMKKDYAKYIELRPEYINTPSFYFDVADWFFKHNNKEKAILILTSVAEIDIENASLFRLLGYRLKEYGEYSLETYICKKVIQWRPMEPQSYRDYALALQDEGKYQDAINSLYSVLTQSYANNISSNSAGIEEVVVTELNQLIATKKVDHSLVDSKLVKAMPVDIRVVLNWNMNNTDIDLHVTDPNGEMCYYQNKKTSLGGHLSKDITRGYGPEQFMLKKAVKGKYEVFVKYFSDSQVKAEGPSTLMLEIYTNYSDKTEERQVICVQLSKDKKPEKNGLLKVAEFNF